jgi:hypothetical protein
MTTTYEVQYGHDQERGWWWALTIGRAIGSEIHTWSSQRSFPEGVTTRDELTKTAREQVAALRKVLG